MRKYRQSFRIIPPPEIATEYTQWPAILLIADSDATKPFPLGWRIAFWQNSGSLPGWPDLVKEWSHHKPIKKGIDRSNEVRVVEVVAERRTNFFTSHSRKGDGRDALAWTLPSSNLAPNQLCNKPRLSAPWCGVNDPDTGGVIKDDALLLARLIANHQLVSC
jgi:hypothetical protein